MFLFQLCRFQLFIQRQITFRNNYIRYLYLILINISGSNEQSNLVKMRNSNLGQSAPSLTASLVRNDFLLSLRVEIQTYNATALYQFSRFINATFLE